MEINHNNVRDLDSTWGTYLAKKNALLGPFQMENFTPIHYPDGTNVIRHQPGESNTFFLIESTNLRLIRTPFSDIRDLNYDTPILELPKDFNPKEEVIIFSLNY